MLTAGATDSEIADAVAGVGEEIAASLRQQQENGVPAEVASLARRRRGPAHRRAYDRHIDIQVTEAEYEAAAALAGDEQTVQDWALALVRAAIAADAEAEAS